MTAEEPITLPGAIPGLLRRASPVVSAPGRFKAGQRVGLVHYNIGSEDCYVTWGAVGQAASSNQYLQLDLTDATGRMHAIWWLASRWPRGVGQTVFLAGLVRLDHHERAGRRVGVRFGPWAHGEWLDGGSGLSDQRSVAALALLDPDDDRRLLDGSRVVDALALRDVVRFVAAL